MKRKPIKRISDRKKIINKCKDLIRAALKIERGAFCEICGKPEADLPYPLSLFHILNTQRYPRMELHRFNILLSCWCPAKYYYMPYCHNIWHHSSPDDPKFQRVHNKIVELRGKDYIDTLRGIDKLQPKMTMTHIHMMHEAFKHEAKTLEENNEIYRF